MIFLNTLLLAVALLTSMQEMFREYRMQLSAYALYERHSYREAETAFEKLATLSHEPKVQNTAHFNQACTLYMQGKFPETAALFAQSAKPGSKYQEIRHNALFNEGNALAMNAVGNSSKAQKIALFRQSLNRFKTVLLTNPGDGDAKINYEIVRRYLHELETPEKGSSSHDEKKNNPPPPSGINNSVANRLLDNAQQDESSLMRQLPQTRSATAHGGKKSKDW